MIIQSRKLSVKPYLNIYNEIKHYQKKRNQEINNIFQIKTSDSRREFETQI
jgi:hypothetical protein